MPFVGNRDFAVQVVGESFYEDNFRERFRRPLS